MTDLNSESTAATSAEPLAPDPDGVREAQGPEGLGEAAGPDGVHAAPRGFARARRNPVVRVAAALVGLALGWGVAHVAINLWDSRHDNTPVSSSSHAPSGALRVSGGGITLTFPAGWLNVPTTPNKMAEFLRKNIAKYPHLRGSLRSQVENMQVARHLAMLAYRFNRHGRIDASITVVIMPTTMPPGGLMPQAKQAVAQFGIHQRDSFTAFGKYRAGLVTYRLPRLAGKAAKYGAEAFLHGPSSTPLIAVTTTNAKDAMAIMRQIASTITFN